MPIYLLSVHASFGCLNNPVVYPYINMNDIWDEDAEEPSNTRKVEREHSNAGYLAGVTKAKEQNHQPGFDEGYSEGAEIGLRAGRIIGTFQALGLKDMELMALKELTPRDLFSYEYYNKEAKPLFDGSNHPLILKWEEKSNMFLK